MGGPSPGVAGAASEHPLEGVESNGVRTRGRLSPLYKKDCIAAVLECSGSFDFVRFGASAGSGTLRTSLRKTRLR